MISLLTVLVLFGVLFQPVNGAACGIGHCMKCDDNHCTECKYGWYGRYCTRECRGCWYSGCERHTGICKQCAPGYYTQSCLQECPHHCRLSYDDNRYCNRTTGHCIEGCEVSFWGSQCDTRCNTNCEESVCEQKDGTCLQSCIDGWFGLTCSKTCPDNCLYKRCRFISGECSEECKHGFYGRMCNISCHNCIDDKCTFNELTQILYCNEGCKHGWTSTDCKQRCSNRCQYGVCEINGTCKSCTDGYYGDMCTRECQNCHKCERKTGQCITHYHVPDGGNGRNISDDEKNVSAVSVTTYSVILLWSTYLVTYLTLAL